MFCRLGGCWLAPGGGKFLSLFGVWFGREVVASFCFQARQVPHTLHVMCVGFLELMKQGEAFSALLVVRGFAEQQVCLCFDGLFCLCGMLLGV